jgi:O-antigen/teichoic acid export membrane protein
MTATESPARPADVSEAPSAVTIARASALGLIARVVSGSAALGTAVITTNVLDTEGRGVYAITTTWVGIIATMLTAGTTVLAADLIFKRQSVGTLHRASLVIAGASALVLIPLSLGLAPFIDSTTPATLLCAAVLTVLVTYSNFVMSIYQACGDVLRVNLTLVAMAGFPLLATGAAALVFEATVATLIAAWAAAALVTAAVQLLAARRAVSGPFRQAGRVGASIMRRSLGVTVANGTMLLWSRIDILVVAAVLSTSDAGVYSIPVALSGGLLLLSRSLLTATYRPIMSAPVTEVAERLSAALRHSVLVVLAGGLLSVPVVALGAGFVFGEAYSQIWQPYAILVLGSACICVAEILRHFLVTRLERSRELVVLGGVMLVVNGVLAAGGAALFGLIGAAVATTASSATAAFWLVAVCAGALGVSKRQLVVPRLSDLVVYRQVARSLVGGR